MLESLKKISQKIAKMYLSMQVDAKKLEISQLDQKIGSNGFWDNPFEAGQVQKKRRTLNDVVSIFDQIQNEIKDLEDFIGLAEENDTEMQAEIQNMYDKLVKKIEALEFRKMLSGELDASSAIVSINSGAGGTESQDWVSMLLRMYLRWAELHEFKTSIVDFLSGEEAGYKNVTFTVEGDYAFGYLQAENGVHRLVRISPFDSNARRHTSFASIGVVPQIDDDIEIDMNESDLRIDTFRASGAGGQHVNTTDSAVRITHIPTGVVAQCQNERSQHKNKASAMKILKSRLYERELKEREAKQAAVQSTKKGIDFGSQIRSYVLHPYQLIKDHRTNFESGKTTSVLDGEIDDFIKEYLLLKSES